jgi:hypothetical protein
VLNDPGVLAGSCLKALIYRFLYPLCLPQAYSPLKAANARHRADERYRCKYKAVLGAAQFLEAVGFRQNEVKFLGHLMLAAGRQSGSDDQPFSCITRTRSCRVIGVEMVNDSETLNFADDRRPATRSSSGVLSDGNAVARHDGRQWLTTNFVSIARRWALVNCAGRAI